MGNWAEQKRSLGKEQNDQDLTAEVAGKTKT
jgi:hypothetical protein